MEEDFSSNHESGRLPILDMVMWVENSTISHQHYAKPMASREVVMAKSAFPASTKKNILLEEGSRWLRNCYPKLPWLEKAKHLETFNVAMAEGGHKVSYRKMIITRVLARYETSLQNHRSGTKRMYRTKSEKEAHIRTVGKSSKDDWFKKGGFTHCLTIPTTPGGRLAALVMESLEKCPAPDSTRTRVLERGGRSIRFTAGQEQSLPSEDLRQGELPSEVAE